MSQKSKDKFTVREISFQESVEVAAEDYGDALDSFDPSDTAGSSPSKTPDLMAAPAPTPPTSSQTSSATMRELPAATPRPGMVQRLIAWLRARA